MVPKLHSRSYSSMMFIFFWIVKLLLLPELSALIESDFVLPLGLPLPLFDSTFLFTIRSNHSDDFAGSGCFPRQRFITMGGLQTLSLDRFLLVLLGSTLEPHSFRFLICWSEHVPSWILFLWALSTCKFILIILGQSIPSSGIHQGSDQIDLRSSAGKWISWHVLRHAIGWF